MQQEVNIITAFIAGFVSFISPCVLPLVPAYISYISNVSIEEIKKDGKEKSKLIFKVSINSILFIAGFSLVFIALGASATLFGNFLLSKSILFSKVAGIIIIIFGLNIMGVFSFGMLYKEKRFNFQNISLGLFTPLVMGMAFAFGWTPCIGPILATILAFAAAQETLGQGIKLLVFYSLGLGIPFFLTAIMFNSFLAFYTKIRNYFRIIEIFSGAFLIVIGFLILTNRFQQLAGFFINF